MRFRIALILSILSMGKFSHTQNVFNNVYDFNNDNDVGYEIIETNDGNFLVAGSSSLENLLIKITPLGDTIWRKKYDFFQLGGNPTFCILELPFGGFMICGGVTDTANLTGNAYLMKIDAQGDSLWVQQYGSVENDIARCLAQTSDGGFVLSGWTFNTSNTSFSDAWVFKTDSLGNMLWQKQLDEYGNSEFIEGLVVNADSTIVIGGETMINSTTSRAYLVKLKPNGDTLWKKQFGGPEGAGIFQMDTTSDKGYIIAGAKNVNGEQRAYAAKLDSLGNVVWESDFARGDRNYSFGAIHELPSGNFMAAGVDIDVNQPILTGEPRVRLFELNALGDSIWSKQYTHYGGTTDDYVFDMKLTSDGGYIMCGYIINGSLPQKNDVLVIKVDSNGCADTTCQLAVGVAPNPRRERW